MSKDLGRKEPGKQSSGVSSLGADMSRLLSKATAGPGRDHFDQTEFDEFRQFLQDACGIALGDNKQYLVSNRIRRLLDDNNQIGRAHV